jgi:alkylated DNA repair dioxygenase AlkB
MAPPQGFQYWPQFLSAKEEAQLVAAFAAFEFRPFEFRGYFGKRRVVSFGWRYDFNDLKLKRAAEIPDFLRPIRDRAEGAASLPRGAIEHAMITEYEPGAAIGWHKDRSIFDDVVGVSLAGACVFRLRRKAGTKWDRVSIAMAPRSAYALSGAARSEWKHSIPTVDALRYSITFRTMKKKAGAPLA